MKKRSYSLRGSIFAVVLSLAATALIALVFSANLYERFVFDIEREATKNLIGFEVSDLNKQLTQYSTELGITLQSINGLRQAIRENTPEKAITYLNDHFHQYFVTAGIIKLEKIYLLDKDYHHLVQSDDGMQGITLAKPICPDLLQKAKNRQGAERLKILSGLCTFESKSFHSVLVPVGTLNPKGYLQILIDPTYNMNSLSRELKMPVRVSLNNGQIAFTSQDWPNMSGSKSYLFVDYPVKEDNKAIYRITAANNISAFQQAFRSTTLSVITVAVFIVTIGLIVSILVLKGSLRSLKILSKAARKTGEGDYEQMPESSCLELDDVITSYNTMVTHVQNSQHRLKQEVESATKQLRNALDTVEKRNLELEHAIKLADQASTTKSMFLANMSHELRTPLNAVIGYAEMLEDDLHEEIDQQALLDLRKIKSAGKHLLSIVKDILDLSKIEAGKLEIQLTEFDISNIIEDILPTVADTAKSNNNEVHFHSNDAPYNAFSDPDVLKKIIENLIDNAVKYTENGQIDISITSDKYLGTAVYLIEVKDNGIGIAKEHQDNIFEAFRQADNSSTRAFDGTGLGLALSRQLSNILGGSLFFESEEGKGSTFSVRIPIRFVQ